MPLCYQRLPNVLEKHGIGSHLGDWNFDEHEPGVGSVDTASPGALVQGFKTDQNGVSKS